MSSIQQYFRKGKHRASAPSNTGRIAAASAVAVAVGLISAQTASAAEPTNVWDDLANCESSGNWSINTGNGFSGGLQFTPSTWRAYGGSGSPTGASREEQIAVATRVQAGQGWGAWPACSKKLGLSGKPPGAATPKQKASPKAVDKKKVTPPTQAAPKTTPKVTAPKHAATGGYEVVAGDTLSKIAARNHVAGGWQALFAKNRGTVSNPNQIYPGEKLSM
jgi:resuscitation-promoting factor RpfA